ncbi:NAD(P)-dependent oxidoreductase [Bradyrhizobium sp. GCM10027634]|uniref:NAD(P)-dependent oxidoreductase n=1 Tax=unclassified Bradyrhizobium TaxID=2631580 RepID=UPI00263A5AE8|nr:NAD(P)H-binding protein [Bradyrhizobium sp. WYCCWR 12677]MDN5005501.1 NAD(P)H-binding protein [Bradyrhizobium sp. WYCCWR 12677]
MKISVLGATGGTGQTIVRQALEAGHNVTALVRRPEALRVTGQKLSILVGDARDPDIIDQLVVAHDAVICSLGITVSRNMHEKINDDVRPDVCTVSTKLLFESMLRYGVKRIVLMSTHGAGRSKDESPYVVRLRGLVQNRILDKDEMEEFIASNRVPIDWTVIRNPLIYDGPLGRPHDVYTRIELNRSAKITYADLAAFALAEIEVPRHVGQFLTITEPLDDLALMAEAEVAKIIVRRG